MCPSTVKNCTSSRKASGSKSDGNVFYLSFSATNFNVSPDSNLQTEELYEATEGDDQSETEE